MSCCDAQWGGLRTEHCPVAGCHQTFSSSTSGDMHRVGKHDVYAGPDRRRCLTVVEMRDRGMTQNASGYWMSPGGRRDYGA